MAILITGATGLIGRALANRLLGVGVGVRVLSRRPHRIREYFGDKVDFFEWHPMTETPPSVAFAGIDVVVNLMGEPVRGRWTREKKRRIRDSRVVSTAKIVAEIGARPIRLINASSFAIYPGKPGEAYTETSPLGPAKSFIQSVARKWEATALEASHASVALMRFGMVTGPDAYPRGYVRRFARGRGIMPGTGDQIVPLIDIDDVVLMLIWAASRPELTGPINCVAPQLARLSAVIERVEALTGRKRRMTTPPWFSRMISGPSAVYHLGSWDVRPDAALAHGFEFLRPDAEAILEHALPGSRARLIEMNDERRRRVAAKAKAKAEKQARAAKKAAARARAKTKNGIEADQARAPEAQPAPTDASPPAHGRDAATSGQLTPAGGSHRLEPAPVERSPGPSEAGRAPSEPKR